MNKLLLLLTSGVFALAATVAQAENGYVFPPDQTTQVCDDTTALVWNGKGNVRCEKVIKSLPKIGKPIVGDYTGNIVGVEAINKVIEEGIQLAWGSFELDKEYNRTACILPASPTNEQVVNLYENPGCAQRICNGYFKNKTNPISYSMTGVCGIGASPGTSCYETYGPGVPVINMACMWMLTP